MKAHAVVASAPNVVEFVDVNVPEPSEDDVVIRVTHSWISNGTESSFVRGERVSGDTPWREGNPPPFPIVPGYQKIGIVEWVGRNVSDVSVGETVFATVSKLAGEFLMPFGGHVSPAVTPRSQVWKIPDGVDPLAVSCLVLTQVGYNCGTFTPVVPGDAAVVIGDGMVGHWAAQTLMYRGARVMMTGKHDERLSLLKVSAEDRVVNILREDPLQAAKEWAPTGLRLVVDTAGSVSSLEAFIPLMKRGGDLVSAGFYGTKGYIDIQRMRDKELSLHAPAGWTKEKMDQTLALIARGIISTTHLITHRLPVSQVALAFDLINSRREHVLGVILDWT